LSIGGQDARPTRVLKVLFLLNMVDNQIHHHQHKHK
jgi:hypothetical protein